MSEINWSTVIPSALSAVATAAAAFAAFGSLRVSRQSKFFSERNALAIHHASAAIALTQAVDDLENNTKDIYEIAYKVWQQWPREIEIKDHRSSGGSNPRPLRHVLANASEMLAKYGSEPGINHIRTRQSMLGIVRGGVNNLSDAEYEHMLKQADGGYGDFESIFGEPSSAKAINESKAFRWAYCQLVRRIDEDNWCYIWEGAWLENGWLEKLRSKHKIIKPILESIVESLSSEESKLLHTAFPLNSNPSLYSKYRRLINIVKVLLEDCSLDYVESCYRNLSFKDDAVPLIIYAMGIACLTVDALNSIYEERS